MSENEQRGLFSRLFSRESAALKEIRRQVEELERLEAGLERPYMQKKVANLRGLCVKIAEHNAKYDEGDDVVSLMSTTLGQAIQAISESQALFSSGIAPVDAKQRLLDQLDGALDSMLASFEGAFERLIAARLQALSANLETLDMLATPGQGAGPTRFNSRALEIGQRTDLTDLEGLHDFNLGLSWVVGEYDHSHPFEVHAVCIPVGGQSDTSRLVEATSTSVGYGTDRVRIAIDLDTVPQDVQTLVFALVIEAAGARKQNFATISKLAYRLLGDADRELAHHKVTREFVQETAVEVVIVYRRKGAWRLVIKDEGYKDGLSGLRRAYPEGFFSPQLLDLA